MGFKQLSLTRKVLKMALKLLFAVVCLAAVQAKNIDSYENIDIVAVAGNFAPVEQDANRGKLPGKKLPIEVLKEMEANAKRAGCKRGCLICLSHIKCTAKMKKFIPEDVTLMKEMLNQ